MGTYDVRDWLESLGIVNACYSGRIDNEQEKVLCVYDDRMDVSDNPASMGGYDYTKIYTFKATVVLQWNEDPEETEKAAIAFIERLIEISKSGSFTMGDYIVSCIIPMNTSVNLYWNENNLCQRKILFDIVYSKLK